MKTSERWLWMCASACLVVVALPGCSTDGGRGRCVAGEPNTICTIAGTGMQGDGDNLVPEGPAEQIDLSLPIDLTVSPDGELWILDFNNFVVRALDARGNLRIVVGSGGVGDSPAPGFDRAPALDARFSHISDLAFHGDYLYLAAWHNSRVKRVRLSDMTVENFAGRGVRMMLDGDGGPALEAALDLPSGLAFAPDGSLAVMDQGSQLIRIIDPGGVIQTFAGRCVVESEDSCVAGEEPAACPGSQKLVCGDVADCPGPCKPGYAGDGGPALEARLGLPFGAAVDPGGHLAYDAAGNLYFTDTNNHRIRKVDLAGTITTVAGTGTRGYTGDGGPATAAQLNRPVDLAIDADGTIYFTDVSNHCIRKIDPAGIIERVAGQCDASTTNFGAFSGDGGSPLDAQLARPHGLHLADGKLYVADTRNHRVRVVNLPR